MKNRFFNLLACPICKSNLSLNKTTLICTKILGHGPFPIIDGIPILLNEENSLFSISELVVAKSDSPKKTKSSILKRTLYYLEPAISRNLSAKSVYESFAQKLLSNSTTATDKPKIIVVGGGQPGSGIQELLDNPKFDILETDIYFGPRTNLICDGHDLPFCNDSIDGVIIQAVLEHVLDPQRVVDEIYRVLKMGGVVYADTPFMQQVHMGRYDFTRFTALGHRRLFRHFAEIESGMSGGPGVALAWSLRYFLRSFANTYRTLAILTHLSSFLFFWLKYFDSFLSKRRGAADAASAYYFFGSKNETPLPDKELIKQYKGLIDL